jgi:hypothetical protein
VTRPIMSPGSPRCYCTTCGHLFLTHVAFDIHRGIEASDDEFHMDLGRCLTVKEMEYVGLTQYEPWVWGTAAEISVAEKFKAMREMREPK